ncbi:MAG: NUDIX domain-containing protein [Alphaproteobacteria bacterium]|nr:NUDIX domain-containing protein [Alphaproteobacteria bacterium]MCB9974423.1 NUDIX domain-containing protein [Rhodospirillales bacterium]
MRKDQEPRSGRRIEGPFHAAGEGVEQSDGAPSPFTFLQAHTPVPDGQITATLLVPFMPDGRILVIEHSQRGFDIPGGHKDITDKTSYETARRELLEETGALVGQITPCLIMETEPHTSSKAQDPSEPSYMVVMTGVVQNLGRFNPSGEVIGRHLLTPEVFLESYGGEYQGDMAFIVRTAKQTIESDHGQAPDFSGMN